MIITRHNYEEYFLLYVDNELSLQERRQVEAFVKENGDLEEELNMLKQTVLRPEKAVIFQNKGQLMKKSSGIEPINELNYQDYFVLYGDDELSVEENDMVEQFVYKNPQYQTEFELILQARFTPDTSIVFPDKESLYKKEKEETKVIYITWMRIAAAAVVLLFAGGLGWNLFFNNSTPTKTGKPEQVAVTDKTNNSTKDSSDPKLITTDPGTNAPLVAKTTDETQSKDESAVKKTNKEKIRNISPKDDQSFAFQGKKTDPKEFEQINGTKSNLSTVENVQPIETVKVDMNKVASLSVPENKAVDQVNMEEKMKQMQKNDVVQTGLNMNTEDELEVLNTSVKKNTSRGLFRKVTRVLGSVANLGPKDKETDNGKGLRIANVEIGRK